MSKVGIVYYADDPERKTFRVVYPSYALGETDAVLDGPATHTQGQPILDDDGKPHQWHTFGTDPKRKAVLEKVEHDDPRVVMTGTP